MGLTEKEAVDISVELWTWLAKTGNEDKEDWKGWKKYGEMSLDCPLCEYSFSCLDCPYSKKFAGCMVPNSPFERWVHSSSVTGRKRYAKLFLEQLKEMLK